MWNDHWSIMKPAYFIIWFSFTIILDFLCNDISGPNRLYSINMWSTPAEWKQYNKMAVLHFFRVNFSLYILFSMGKTLITVCTAIVLQLFHLYLGNNDECIIFLYVFNFLKIFLKFHLHHKSASHSNRKATIENNNLLARKIGISYSSSVRFKGVCL